MPWTPEYPALGNYPWYAHRFLGRYLGNSKMTTSGNNSYAILCPSLSKKPSNNERLGIGYNDCWDTNIRSVKTSGFVNPAIIIVFADTSANNITGQWDYNAAGHLAFRWAQFYKYDAAPRCAAGYTRWTMYRHLRRTNVSFADGHVQSFASPHSDNDSTQFGVGLHAAFQNKQVKYKAR